MPKVMSFAIQITAGVGPDRIAHTASEHPHRQPLQHDLACEQPPHAKRQKQPAVLIDEHQRPKGLPLTGPIPYQVVAASAVWMRRPKSNTQALVESSSPVFARSRQDGQCFLQRHNL